MKKADLIICTDGNRVIKNLEGSNSSYYAHSSEKIVKVLTCPATPEYLRSCCVKLGIEDIEKVATQLRKVIIDKLSYIPESQIAYGFEKDDSGTWHDNWYYELDTAQ